MIRSLVCIALLAPAAHAGVQLGAGAGPRVAGGPSTAGGSFAGEVGAIFSSAHTDAPPALRWGFAFEAGFAVLKTSDGTLGGSDLALVSRFHWRLGPVYVGPRAGVVGHFYQFKPSEGEKQSETRQLGFTIGPDLAWPISRKTSFEARVSYESTNADIDDRPNGHPPHAVDLFVGISREL